MNLECPECLNRLSEYFDRELTASEQQKVEAHLLGCPECQEQLKELEILRSDIVWTINNLTLPPGLEKRILANVKHEEVRTRKQVWLTGLILTLLVSPLLVLTTPLLATLFNLLYTTGSALWRTWPTLLSAAAPQAGVGIGIVALLISGLGIYLIRKLLRGLHFDEVFS